MSGYVGLAGKAGRRVEYRAGVLMDKEGDMHLLLVVGLAVGTDAGNGGVNCPEVEVRLPIPSEWALEWVEEDGKKDYVEGRLKLDRKGRGELLCGGLLFEIREYHLGRQSSIDLLLRDLTAFGGANTESREFGTYRLDGDRLFLCLGDERRGRPIRFATQPGDDRMLLVFKRKK
jgi:hypothetical protein